MKYIYNMHILHNCIPIYNTTYSVFLRTEFMPVGVTLIYDMFNNKNKVRKTLIQLLRTRRHNI